MALKNELLGNLSKLTNSHSTKSKSWSLGSWIGTSENSITKKHLIKVYPNMLPTNDMCAYQLGLLSEIWSWVILSFWGHLIEQHTQCISGPPFDIYYIDTHNIHTERFYCQERKLLCKCYCVKSVPRYLSYLQRDEREEAPPRDPCLSSMRTPDPSTQTTDPIPRHRQVDEYMIGTLSFPDLVSGQILELGNLLYTWFTEISNTTAWKVPNSRLEG